MARRSGSRRRNPKADWHKVNGRWVKKSSAASTKTLTVGPWKAVAGTRDLYWRKVGRAYEASFDRRNVAMLTTSWDSLQEWIASKY